MTEDHVTVTGLQWQRPAQPMRRVDGTGLTPHARELERRSCLHARSVAVSRAVRRRSRSGQRSVHKDETGMGIEHEGSCLAGEAWVDNRRA
jgi:hypothetical protein